MRAAELKFSLKLTTGIIASAFVALVWSGPAFAAENGNPRGGRDLNLQQVVLPNNNGAENCNQSPVRGRRNFRCGPPINLPGPPSNTPPQTPRGRGA